jgi:hypothetical protein
MSARDRNWRDWTAGDWNEALFEHFFRDSDGEDRPVQRIPVTRGELVKIVSDPEADAQEIQEAFLRVVRTPSHIDLNHRLSGYPVDRKAGWIGSAIPPFFIELAFSCLVASPPDGEIRNDGDFRKRLAMLQGHDQTVANYPLEWLAPLWRAFCKWLDASRAAGHPYRRLELPPLDHRVRIGYSINLVFPSRKDQITLTKVLSNGGFEGDPPIPAVFDLVGKTIEKFSASFRRAYEEFRDAFRSKEKNLERFPFWGAVKEAVACALVDEVKEDGERRSLKLVLEPGGVILLLSTVPGDVISKELSFIEADTPYGEFGSVLCVGRSLTRDLHQATHRLLRGVYRDVLTGSGWQAIKIAVEQGVLLFKKTESLSWELTFTRQEEGGFRALVRDSLVAVFLEAFRNDRRPNEKPSQYDGWSEMELFPGELLGSLTYADDSPLAEIRCLQPTVSGPRLSLIGGCPVDAGYLGIPACLPLVRAPLSDAVEVVPVGWKEGRETIRLTRVGNDSPDFSFPGDLQIPLKGRHRVVGSRHDGTVLVKKEVVFRPEIVVNAYARPTDTNAWEMEAGGPDVVTYDKDQNDTARPSDGTIRGTHARAKDAVARSRASVLFPRGKSALGTWSRMEVSTLPKGHGVLEPREFAEADRFMEICGGFAMRRKGIPEADLLDLVRECLTVDRYDQQWDVVRAWMEGGHLDRLQYKRWRRTEYFPRVPRFVLKAQGARVRGVLFGLATATFRNRADVELLKLGAESAQVESSSRWVVPAPAWVAPSEDPYVAVSKTLGLEEPVRAIPIVETLWSLRDVVASRNIPPQYYERSACWDWDRGWFSRDMEPSGEGVEVIRFQRPDRPPYHQVRVDGEHVWWSTSRNWSLLLAHELRGDAVFALLGADQVVRVSKGQVYLPLPVGRYLATTGVTAPGPASDGDGRYAYQFRNSKERLRFLSAIWGSGEFDRVEMGRWARWILALSKRATLEHGVRAVQLPSSIRQILERFQEVPEFRELSRARIDPSLLPRLREGLTKFAYTRGA